MGLDAASYAEAGETLSIDNSASLFAFLPSVIQRVAGWQPEEDHAALASVEGRVGHCIHVGEGVQQRLTHTLMPLVEWRLLRMSQRDRLRTSV